MAASADLAELRGQKLEALINIGVAKLRLGDLADAWRFLDRAQRAASLAGDQLRESTANTTLAEWFTVAGLCDRAIAHANKGLELAIATKARFPELYAHLRLAAALLDAEEPEKAADAADRASSVAVKLRAPNYETFSTVLAGRVAARQGDAPGARRLLERAVVGAAGIGAGAVLVEAQTYLSLTLLSLGEVTKATRLGKEAIESARRVEAKHSLWLAHDTMGRIHLANGERDEAQAQFREAVSIVEGMWWPLWAVGFAQVQSIKQPIVDVYMRLLHTTDAKGQRDQVERILSLSPWSFLRARWESVRDSEQRTLW